jgi:hypothetical protein
MIYVVLSNLLWLPAILGFETIFHWIYQRVTRSSYDIREVSEPILGFAIVGTLATIVNFFLPVNGAIAIATLGLGWCLYFLRIRKWHARLSWSTAIVGGLGLIAVSLMASRGDKLFDTGLYYLQTLKWLQEGKIPLGLANLHSRLAFNQSWFSISAVMELPFFFQSGNGYFVSTAMILWLFGLNVMRAIDQLWARNASAGSFFLPLSFVLLISDSKFLPLNASSTSPDVPSALLVLLATYIGLQTLQGSLEPLFGIWTSLLIALFATTIKFSVAPIALVPVSLTLYAYFRRTPVNWKNLAKLLMISVFILLIPWVLRGICLSGCILFPLGISCIPKLPWSWVAPSELDLNNQQLWIMSWARRPEPGYLPSQVLSNWDWFQPWLKMHLETANTFQLIIMAWLISLFIWPLAYVTRKKSDYNFSILWVAVPLFIGNVYWFFTAPEPRFGIGLLWALPTAIVADNLAHLIQALPGKVVFYKLGFLSILGICMIPVGRELIRGSAYDIHKRINSTAQFFFDTSPIPSAKLSARRTSNGVQIYVPKENYQCWAAPLPCAPYFGKNLLVINFHSYLTFIIRRN